VNATAAKLNAFAISGFIAAFAGALFVFHQQSLGITAYSVQASRQAFIQVVIGGLGTVPGAILGAVFIQGVDYFRTSLPEAIRPYTIFLTTGIGLIFVLLLLPGGFSQVFYSARDRLLKWAADRRGILVPSMVADARADGPGGITTDAPTLGPDSEPPTKVDVREALVSASAGIE
jgi:branched-chain amino acid transport system permease protein